MTLPLASYLIGMAFLSFEFARGPGLWARMTAEPAPAYLATAFGLALGAMGVGAVLVPAVSPREAALSLALYGLGSAVTAWKLLRHYPFSALGWGNVATQARLALVALLLAMLLAGQSGWGVAAAAVAALALDGVDGWLARRAGLASAFGARFDMEVDSVFALLLALHALAGGVVGPAVLALGLARYVFWAATALWPWLAAPLPERLSRKAVCVAQLSVLIALQVPPLPGAVALLSVAGVLGALVWSFGRDVLWLARRRPSACDDPAQRIA